jgi:lipoprotein-releasing system permease protein
MVGLAIGTAALIIVLSVFNGFESVVTSMFSVFDPDIKITASKGKTFNSYLVDKQAITGIEGVANYTEVIEENALLYYKKQQYLATIKGVDSLYQTHSPLTDSMLVAGNMVLQEGNFDFAVPGYGVAYFLGLDLNAPDNLISVYIPRRTGNMNITSQESFSSLTIRPTGIFSVQQDFDDKYMLVPLRFARQLLEYESEITSIEIRLAHGADVDKIRAKVKQICGDGFKVQNRFEQQEVLYKIMKSEKWAVFLILTFILIVASFNVIGSLSMLILDKKKDILVLNSLGASTQTIRRIFFTEGLLVAFTGALAGLVLGLGICLLQQQFGIIKLQGGGSFVIQAYPVKIMFTDFVYVFFTILIIGCVAAWIPAQRITRFLPSR